MCSDLGTPEKVLRASVRYSLDAVHLTVVYVQIWHVIHLLEKFLFSEMVVLPEPDPRLETGIYP